MRFFNDYKVDGKAILVPDEDAIITRTDLDSADSGRDESGYMHRVLVRSRVKTWQFSYGDLSREEYLYMKSLFDGKAEFKFTYGDDGGALRITVAYCATDSVAYRNAKTGRYKNFRIKIVEC